MSENGNGNGKLLAFAQQLIPKINRAYDGMTIEEATSWLFRNWFALFINHPREAMEIRDKIFDLFMRSYLAEVNDLNSQSVLSIAIGEDMGVDPDIIFLLVADSWAGGWREHLRKNGIEVREIHEDKIACRMTNCRLQELMNRVRREKGLWYLYHHDLHAQYAKGHSEQMAKQEKLFKSSQSDLEREGILTQDVVCFPYQFPSGSKQAAKGILNEIIWKGNVLSPKVTGVGANSWMGKGNILYATFCYSDVCVKVMKKSFTAGESD